MVAWKARIDGDKEIRTIHVRPRDEPVQLDGPTIGRRRVVWEVVADEETSGPPRSPRAYPTTEGGGIVVHEAYRPGG